MRQNFLEMLVGGAVVLVALVFSAYVYSVSGLTPTRQGYLLHAVFQNVEGIRVGSDVRLGGVKIGAVTAQTLDPKTYDVRLTLSIDSAVRLPEDTTAKITSDGLIGAKFIRLEPGGNPEVLKEGGTLSFTQGSIDLWALASSFLFNKNKENPATPPPPGQKEP